MGDASSCGRSGPDTLHGHVLPPSRDLGPSQWTRTKGGGRGSLCLCITRGMTSLPVPESTAVYQARADTAETCCCFFNQTPTVCRGFHEVSPRRPPTAVRGLQRLARPTGEKVRVTVSSKPGEEGPEGRALAEPFRRQERRINEADHENPVGSGSAGPGKECACAGPFHAAQGAAGCC